MMGWTCPGCGSCFSPSTLQCPNCPLRTASSSNTFTFAIYPCDHSRGTEFDGTGNIVCRKCRVPFTQAVTLCTHDFEQTTGGYRCRKCGEAEPVLRYPYTTYGAAS